MERQNRAIIKSIKKEKKKVEKNLKKARKNKNKKFEEVCMKYLVMMEIREAYILQNGIDPISK